MTNYIYTKCIEPRPSAPMSRMVEDLLILNNDYSKNPTMHPQFFISKPDLVDGQWYEGRCRNSTQARWSAEKQRFEYVRTKFDMNFVEEICTPEDEKHYDVFYAKNAIPQEQVLKPIPVNAKAQMVLTSAGPETKEAKAPHSSSLRPNIFQEARE